MANRPKEIRVNFPKELAGGAYSNNMVVSHTKEEFIMDFLMVAPPSGALTARIIVSPGHIKRIINALQENISSRPCWVIASSRILSALTKKLRSIYQKRKGCAFICATNRKPAWIKMIKK